MMTLDQAFDAGLLIDEAGRPIVSRKQLVDAKWITVHPNGAGTKGTPVQISENGTVLAGMGGKFNGKKLGELKGGSAADNSDRTVHAEPTHTLSGSEKQTSWAHNIRSAAYTVAARNHASALKALESAEKKLNNGGVNTLTGKPVDNDRLRERIEKYKSELSETNERIAMLSKIKKASTMIDIRNQLGEMWGTGWYSRVNE